jgi:hypothetical protein
MHGSREPDEDAGAHAETKPSWRAAAHAYWRRMRRAVRTLVRRAAAVLAILGLFGIAVTVLFIGVTCYHADGLTKAHSQALRNVLDEVKGYARDGSATYLTLPEWYIVYSTEEYASFVKDHPPSRFPYFGSIGQYWRYYGGVCGFSKDTYPFNAGVHLMLGVIGVSFSFENAVKGTYENTVGRFTEWVSSHDTEEDAFAYRTTQEYARFMHTTPWYEFPFSGKLADLWRQTPLWGHHVVRKWERKLALSTEYGVKAAYGWVIRKSTGAVYGPEDLPIHAWVEHAPETVFADPRVRRVRAMSRGSYLIVLPRYEAFTAIVTKLAGEGVRFLDIAGNDEILLTAIAPSDWRYDARSGQLVLSERILTNPDRKRIAVNAPVGSLHVILADLAKRGVKIEHLYDY